MLDYNTATLADVEAELRRDLEAISRVRRLMDAKGISLGATVNNSATSTPAAHAPEAPDHANADAEGQDDTQQEAAASTSVRAAIEQLLNSNPAASWTTQKVLKHLRATGFPLQAKKPIYTIGQSLNVLAKKGKIRLQRKGAGSSPNIYRGRSDRSVDQAMLPMQSEEGLSNQVS